MFFVLINRFRQFGAEKMFINSFLNFLKNLLKIILNVKNLKIKT